jgi:DNA helicase TIP49 (TBP-interacting protein)
MKKNVDLPTHERPFRLVRGNTLLIIAGPQATGKTMLAKNILQHAKATMFDDVSHTSVYPAVVRKIVDLSNTLRRELFVVSTQDRLVAEWLAKNFLGNVQIINLI